MRALAVLAVVHGVAACSGNDGGRAQQASNAGIDAGARLYEQNCLPCHREDGQGVPGVYPALGASPVVNGDPKELTQWVLLGRRPSSLPAGRYATQMLVFGWMKDADAAALLSYIRSHFGNTASAVDAALIAEAR